MSHSTHCGFNCPDWTPATSVLRLFPPPLLPPAPPVASLVVGVGHILRPTTVSRFGNLFGLFVDSGVMVRAIAEHERGVGHAPVPCSDDENAVAAVRGANGGSWYAVPFRVIPARGQVTENAAKPVSKESWDVFQQCCTGSKNANESREFGP